MTYRYQYKTLPAHQVIALTDVTDLHPDSYIAEDVESSTLRLLLANGYRWIRTDGDTAIFEKRRLVLPALETRPKPRANQ